MQLLVSLVLAALFVILPASDAGAGALSGLWVGSAEIFGVSQVNKSPADLGFDLELQGTRSRDVLITKGSGRWKYNDQGLDLGSAWTSPSYDDSAWTQNRAPFGFGANMADQIRTIVASQPTIYFRRTISVPSAAQYSTMTIRLFRDDGARVYVNGLEIIRSNLPASFVGFSTPALSELSGAAETAYKEYQVPASALVDGNNCIAVELHRASDTDTDLFFALVLLANVAKPDVQSLVPARSSWSYDDSGADRGATWSQNAYVDSSWKTGTGKFGYGNADIAPGMPGQDTVLQFGPADNKHPTTYFRTHFTVADPTTLNALSLLLLRDDGAVVYLNGTEVLRSNMPDAGTITYTAPPLSSVGVTDANRYVASAIPVSALQAGDNVIAVEVHQHQSELADQAVSGSTETSAPLNLRVLLHVDAGDTVRLLKQVIIMKDNSTGLPVLLTDDSRIPAYGGVEKRDNEAVGVRISSIGYDFKDQGALNPVPNTALCTGSFSTGNTVNCSFTVDRDLPTNPFMHKYNPEHDELNEQYQPIPLNSANHEVNLISRSMSFQVQARYPADPRQTARTAPPGWGATEVGGLFSEALTGLYKDPVAVQGSFTLQRVSSVDALNP